jgi:SNF2 family DNA or RNA helicase
MTSRPTTMSKGLSRQLPLKWSPLPYMRRAVKFLLEHGAAILMLDPGLRKTSITLAAFSFLKKQGVASKMLVIAPLKACYQVWPAELAKWKDFNHLSYVILHGAKKEQALATEADIYIINPEGLEWLIFGGTGHNRKAFSARRWAAFGFDTLTVDELTKFKHSRGVRFKALKLVLGNFTRRWGLTGSPAANGLLDLFGQCCVIDLGNALGRFITHYRFKYFYNPDGNGWKWVPQGGAKDEIYKKLKPLALRMDADDYLQLPEINDVVQRLELPASARKIYDELEDDLVTQIEERIVTAANAATAGGKLWQVCNGGLYVDNDVASIIGGKKRTTLKIHEVKTDWLEDLIDELQGQPLLIAYQFEHDLERLLERFGKDLPRFTGKTAHDQEIEDKWNANQLPFVAGQQDAIAHALNLQEGNAQHLAQYSITWNLETWDQLLRRIRRSGNKAKRVFRHIPIMRDTTDEDRWYALRAKNSGQRALFDALKARRGIR